MKLLTHNMLTSKCLKGVSVGYPLAILVSILYIFPLHLQYVFFFWQAKDIKVSEVEFNPEFIARMIAKVDWPALCKAAENVRYIILSIILLVAKAFLFTGWQSWGHASYGCRWLRKQWRISQKGSSYSFRGITDFFSNHWFLIFEYCIIRLKWLMVN